MRATEKDFEKVLLALYLPGQSGEKQVTIFANLMGWPVERAQAAFDHCIEKGFIGKEKK